MKVKPDPQSASDVERNAYSWNSAANLLFVDQPVGTGFSYSRWPLDYVTNEKQVAQQLYDFLQAFFVQFPQFAGRPLFITGESYAVRPGVAHARRLAFEHCGPSPHTRYVWRAQGHYVPAIGWKIVDANAQGGAPRINLQGIAVGNVRPQHNTTHTRKLSLPPYLSLLPRAHAGTGGAADAIRRI
jgi:hypothetical protein